jgi:hypothetical protein
LSFVRFGTFLIVLFWFAHLPEIDETTLPDTLENQDEIAPLHKQYHTLWGFWAQFSYVGAQVCNCDPKGRLESLTVRNLEVAVATFAVKVCEQVIGLFPDAKFSAVSYSV